MHTTRKDGGRLEAKAFEPLANQVGAWTFHRFGTEQGSIRAHVGFLDAASI